jgi:integrase
MGRDGDGISIERRPKGRWLYRVIDKAGDRKSKTFSRSSPEDDDRRRAGCAVGDKWAKETRARYQLEIDKAGRTEIATILDAYLMGKGGKVCEPHRKLFRRAVDLVITNGGKGEGGCSDMSNTDKMFAVADAAISNLKACRHGQKTPMEASERTKDSYRVALLTLGRYAQKKLRCITFNPFEALDRYKSPRVAKKTYTINELRALVAEEHRADPWFPFVCLVAYTGIRSETARKIAWGMIDWELEKIRIPAAIQKSDNDTKVPLQPELAAILRSWSQGLPRARILPPEIADLTSDQCNQKTQAYLHRCGIAPQGRSVHSFRHTVAAIITANGVPTLAAMDYLGHSATATAKGYAVMAGDYERQIQREGWPVGRGEFYLRRQHPAAQAAANA